MKVAVIDRPDGADSKHLDDIPSSLDDLQKAVEVQRLLPNQLSHIDSDTEVVFVRAGYWNEADLLLQLAPNVSWIHVNMTGVEHLPVSRMVRAGVKLTTCRGVLDRARSGFVLASVLLWSKGVLQSVIDTHRRKTVYRELKANGELTALIIGSGSIGSACAHTMRQAGLSRITGIRRRPEPIPEFDEVCGPEDLQRLIGENDVVVACLPATDETRGIIGRPELEQARDESVFVNVGRGSTVDHIALAEIMLARPGAVAVLDVTDPEPLPENHPIWERENVVISPHMSGDTASRHDAFALLFIDNLRRYSSGEELRNQVVSSSEH